MAELHVRDSSALPVTLELAAQQKRQPSVNSLAVTAQLRAHKCSYVYVRLLPLHKPGCYCGQWPRPSISTTFAGDRNQGFGGWIQLSLYRDTLLCFWQVLASTTLPRQPVRRDSQRATPTWHAPTLTRRTSTNMDPIKTAITAIESRRPGETFLYRKIANNFSVVQSTLTR